MKYLEHDPRVLRKQTNFEYPNLVLDDSYTIGELFDRYFSGLSIPQNSQGIEDTDIDSPLCYDNDLLDTPTRYEVDDYIDPRTALNSSKNADSPTEAHDDSHPEGQAEV